VFLQGNCLVLIYINPIKVFLYAWGKFRLNKQIILIAVPLMKEFNVSNPTNPDRRSEKKNGMSKKTKKSHPNN